MNKKFITLLILPISLCLLWIKNTNSFIQFNTLKAETLMHSAPSNSDLSKSIDWINLKKYWELLNKLESEQTKGSQNINFSEAQKEHQNLNLYLDNLFKNKLISEKKKETLLTLFQQRYNYYQREYQIITCYKPSYTSINLMKTENDIEKQFAALEKLYIEKKINSSVYTTTKNKIKEDLKILLKQKDTQEKYLTDTEIFNLIETLSK